jgi:endoglucanase
MHQRRMRRGGKFPTFLLTTLTILVTVMLAVFLRPMPSKGQMNFNYADALRVAIEFFDANKCGPDAGVDNVFSWRGACHTADGNMANPPLDLTGGFHDAGDHVPFGLPQGFSASLLGWTLYEYRAEFDRASLTPKTLRTLKYFTDYFLKSHPNATTFYYQKGDGNQDHGFWGSPENQTGNRPILVARPGMPASDILGETASALALMSINYRSTDAAYANRCLTAARELFEMGRTNLGRGSDGGGGAFYRSTSHFDDLALAAIALYTATGEAAYLEPVDGWISQPNDGNDNPYQKRWTMAWDDVTLLNLLKMYQITGMQKYADGLRWNLVWYRDTLQKTPAGLPWLDQWGVLRYASAEAGLGFLAYKLFGFNDFFNTGGFIVNYALGNNERNSSYVSNYLNNPPRHPHHRANEPVRGGTTNGMVGGLVGGPSLNGSYNDDVNNFTQTEVALDYNASFVFALAGRLYFANGGQPGNPPPTPTPPPMSPPGNGSGLTGTFYQGTALAGAPLLTRTDPTIDFNWAGGSPVPGVVPADLFSARWQGEVEARTNELYTFYVSHDDGARLWVNDQLIIDNWTDHAATEDSGSIPLQLGQRYSLRLEFYENAGDASTSLSWSTPAGFAKQIIPQTQLYPSQSTPTPDFSHSANPSAVTVNRGASASSTITVTRSGGFTGAVALSASGLPAGVTATFTPASVTGTSSTVTFAASTAATLGPATVTISGTGGGLTRTSTISLTVSETATPNFALSAAPSSLTVNRGASGTSSVAIARSGGFTGSVALSASGLPAGVTAAFTPSSATGASATLMLTASTTAALGPAAVTITGSGGGLSRTTTINLTVGEGGTGTGTGGVTITPLINASGPWFNEEAIRLSNTAPITSLTVTIVIQRTGGVGFSGMYNTIGGQILQSNASTGTTITYQFSLAAGQTLNMGMNWLFSSQMSGTGMPHPTTGDTYTVAYTTGGVSYTQTGMF